jgi:hypothetical protein
MQYVLCMRRQRYQFASKRTLRKKKKDFPLPHPAILTPRVNLPAFYQLDTPFAPSIQAGHAGHPFWALSALLAQSIDLLFIPIEPFNTSVVISLHWRLLRPPDCLSSSCRPPRHHQVLSSSPRTSSLHHLSRRKIKHSLLTIKYTLSANTPNLPPATLHPQQRQHHQLLLLLPLLLFPNIWSGDWAQPDSECRDKQFARGNRLIGALEREYRLAEIIKAYPGPAHTAQCSTILLEPTYTRFCEFLPPTPQWRGITFQSTSRIWCTSS